MTKFDGIQAMLGLSEKEKAQILSLNLARHPGRNYKGGMDRTGRRAVGRLCRRSI